MGISKADFDYIRQLVQRRSAIVLEPGKEYLAESRMLAVIRREGIDSIAALVERLRREPANGLHWQGVEAMTTNETTFFRDYQPFEALRKSVLPELLARREKDRRLNVWSAACSTGQEPYSIAMLLREHFPSLKTWEVRILATDLSNEVLARAREGCYSQLAVNRGLPAALLVKYFLKKGSDWQIKPELPPMIDFQQLNLDSDWTFLPQFDVVFLRYVLIYFALETKQAILKRLRRFLRPGGYLFLGGVETTLNLDNAYEKVQFNGAVCYRFRSEPL